MIAAENIQPPAWFDEREEWCEVSRRLQRTIRHVLGKAGADDEEITVSIEEAQEEVEDLEMAARTAEGDAEDGWAVWAKAALEGGASKAHAWS